MAPSLCRKFAAVALPFVLIVVGAAAGAAPDESGAARPRRIVFLGDSITDGHTYPLLIRQALADSGGSPPICINAGIGGDTAAGMRARLDRDVLAHRPDLVTLLVGTNDAHRGVSPEAYGADVAAICERLGAEKVPIVLLTPPIAGPKAAETEGRIDTYVPVIRDLAERSGHPVADLNARMKAARAAGQDLLESDQIHPNYEGHRVIARVLLDALGHDDVAVPEVLTVEPLPGVVSPWKLRVAAEGSAPLDEKSAADLMKSGQAGADGWKDVTLPQNDPHPMWWLDQERRRGVAVSLDKVVGPGKSYYGVATVDAADGRRAYLNVGADLQTVWLNGKQVYRNDPGVWRGWHPGRERVAVELAAGANQILVETGGQFFLSITDDNTW
jgi:lysophospholipase L1-like esterase